MTTYLLDEGVCVLTLEERGAQVAGNEVAGNGVQLLSAPTLGPCGHSCRRQKAKAIVVVGSKEMMGRCLNHVARFGTRPQPQHRKMYLDNKTPSYMTGKKAWLGFSLLTPWKIKIKKLLVTGQGKTPG